MWFNTNTVLLENFRRQLRTLQERQIVIEKERCISGASCAKQSLVYSINNLILFTCTLCHVFSSRYHLPMQVIHDIFIYSLAVYKVIAGRKGVKPLKIIQNLRTEKKEKLNIFSNYTLPTGCDCTVLDPPGLFYC